MKRQFPSLDTQFVIVKDILAGISIQDVEMKSMFSRLPEILLSDAIYKTNDLNVPLYTWMAVDGNVANLVAALFLVENKDAEPLCYWLKIFKEKNLQWTDTPVISTNKDMQERTIFKSELPQVKLQLCLYHTMRTFHREVTPEK